MADQKTTRPPKALIEDIRPAPAKERSALGKVNLVLDPETQITMVGVVYGLEHQISGDNFTATLFMDHYNQRIKILKYSGTNYEGLILKLRWLAEANGFDKMIAMASRSDWQQFLRHGYVLEGVLKYYLNGEDAYIVSKFRSQDRLTSHSLMEEILLIEKLMHTEVKKTPNPRPSGYQFRLARREDIPELIELYKRIFETYPSPLVHSDYLDTVFHQETRFVVATNQEGHIRAAASAELYHDQKAAELTDCATHPESRGLGLMSHLLEILENELIKEDYICAYTMARARSYGMNSVFYGLGYEFLGRLINNCDIYGAYEDMNIWVKNLKITPPRKVSYATE